MYACRVFKLLVTHTTAGSSRDQNDFYGLRRSEQLVLARNTNRWRQICCLEGYTRGLENTWCILGLIMTKQMRSTSFCLDHNAHTCSFMSLASLPTHLCWPAEYSICSLWQLLSCVCACSVYIYYEPKMIAHSWKKGGIGGNRISEQLSHRSSMLWRYGKTWTG